MNILMCILSHCYQRDENEFCLFLTAFLGISHESIMTSWPRFVGSDPSRALRALHHFNTSTLQWTGTILIQLHPNDFGFKEAHKVKDTYSSFFGFSINESPEIMKLTKTDKRNERKKTRTKHLSRRAQTVNRNCARNRHIHTLCIHSTRRTIRNRNSLHK